MADRILWSLLGKNDTEENFDTAVTLNPSVISQVPHTNTCRQTGNEADKSKERNEKVRCVKGGEAAKLHYLQNAVSYAYDIHLFAYDYTLPCI